MRLRTILELGLATLVVAMAAHTVYDLRRRPAPVPAAQYAPAPSIPGAEKIKTVMVPGPTKIVTIEKPVIVSSLKLPDAIAKDPDKQVTATAQVAPYAGKTDAVSVMDTKTGVSEIELKQEKLPFFGFVNQKETGVRAGVGVNGYTGEVYGRWTFARTGDVYWAAYGAAGTDQRMQAEGKVMLDVGLRW
ncbi:MAG: hypothetical protein ABSC19_06010 [Syntrophorhabdales bacterium]|jgi:hypothetical protein